MLKLLIPVAFSCLTSFSFVLPVGAQTSPPGFRVTENAINMARHFLEKSNNFTSKLDDDQISRALEFYCEVRSGGVRDRDFEFITSQQLALTIPRNRQQDWRHFFGVVSTTAQELVCPEYRDR
ncbi:hypothetical protein H6F89_11355 [Cyanobacteria bacterium FACHB-63]|nr:hypothetical protein [Cyanobacteria bacterium FACHB-63]